MFNFLKIFFDRKSYKLERLNYKKLELVNLLSKELRKLNSPTYYHLRKGLGIASENKEPNKMFDYIIEFNIDEIRIEYCYQIRGSLITIKNHKKLLEYVDQTIQRSHLDYPHDIIIMCSKKTLHNLLENIKIKLNELIQ